MFKIWTEIRASGPFAGKDAAITCLIKAGSNAVIESNRCAGSAVEPANEQTLTACLPKGGGSTLSTLKEGLKALGWTARLATVEDRDWSVAWRRGIRPLRLACRGPGIKVGRGLFIRTRWSRAVKRPGEEEVIIDPSMAFGTGSHPTTKMCLKALVDLLGSTDASRAKRRLLDVGTGSGILMIAALKLGASGALGLEIDPLAMKVARKNLKDNNVKARLSSRPLSRVRGKFSIITANIFSEELRRLAPGLVERVRGGGHIVLSGILREQAPPLVSLYRGLGMRVRRRLVDHEWACLVLSRGATKEEAGA